jgi:thioredoxin-related protein
VVVHLDYPPLSERTPEKIAANPALAKLMRIKEAYNVPGFPTVVLLDDRGEEVGRVEGFSDGMTVHEFLAELAGSGKATRAAP